MTTTTITAAVTSANTQFVTLASVTGLLTGMLIQVDNELMEASEDPNTTTLVAKVIRGVGSVAVKHGINSPARFGTKNEFGQLQGAYNGPNFVGMGQYQNGLFYPMKTPATITTAAAVTYGAGHLLGGIINRNTSGAGRADLVPTAANLVAAMPFANVGTTFQFRVQNDAGAAETITVTTNTGVTVSGTMTVAQSNSKSFEVRITNITAGSEAYTITALGTYTT